jgi:hypothetical protein
VFTTLNPTRCKMSTPRPAPIAGLVSPWSTEQKLLKAYRRLLLAADLDELITATLGPKRTATQREAADERLEYVMPELIQKLRPAQQGPLAELLLGESPDLVGAIRHLINLERNLTHRDEDPRLLLNDDARCKAAGLGRLTQANYHKPHDPANPSARWLSRHKPTAPPLGPPLVLTPAPPTFRGVRKSSRRPKAVMVCRGQLALPFPGGGVQRAAL